MPLLRRINRAIVRSPIGGPVLRAQARNDPGARQRVEWRIRIDRDTAAMRKIVRAELQPDDAAVDVGANKGELTKWFVEIAPRATHHIIEPLPHLAEHLRARFPSVRVHECALSDGDGDAAFFHVVNRPAWSGLHRQDSVADDATVEIRVALRRLDDVVGASRIRLIKIDVEGAELGVLRGAVGTLRRDKPLILLEHAQIHAELFGTTARDVWTFLDAQGYKVAPVAERGAVVDLAAFQELCERSHQSGYDRRAVTNWIAWVA